MNDFLEINSAWLETDEYLGELIAATPPASARRRLLLERRKQFNEQAYFILLFAQFEDHVNETALRIARNSGRTHFNRNRIDATSQAALRRSLSFMDRVAFLAANRGDEGGRDLEDAAFYYDIRCRIAHGAVDMPLALHIPTISDVLRRLARNLGR